MFNFEELDRLNNDIEESIKDLDSVKNEFLSNHNKRMAELNIIMKRINSNIEANEKSEIEVHKLIEDNSKALDKLIEDNSKALDKLLEELI